MVVSTQDQVEFAVPVDQAHGSVVRRTVRQLLEAAAFPAEVVEDVILALGEAFANAVAHGKGSRCEQVGVSVCARQRRVTIEMRYPGEPFETRTPTVPSLDQLTGRGRYLMGALMDSVTYAFPPGETILRMEKDLAHAIR